MKRLLISTLLLLTLRASTANAVPTVESKLVHNETGQVITVVKDYERETPSCKGINVNTTVKPSAVYSRGTVILCEPSTEDVLLHELHHASQDLVDGKLDHHLQLVHPKETERVLANPSNELEHTIVKHVKRYYPQEYWILEVEAYLVQYNLI